LADSLEHALKQEVKLEKADIMDKLKMSKFLPKLSLFESYMQKKIYEHISFDDFGKLDNWDGNTTPPFNMDMGAPSEGQERASCGWIRSFG